MIPSSLKTFMDQLLPATENRGISWQEGMGNGTYKCNHKDYALEISYYYDPDRDVSMYTFSINRKGKSASFTVYDNQVDFSFMSGLSSAIEINAAGLDNIAQDFFS
jgi:hypothetical protein